MASFYLSKIIRLLALGENRKKNMEELRSCLAEKSLS